MRKIKIALSLIPLLCTLNANELVNNNQVKEVSFHADKILYSKALKNFRDKKYEKSYEQFNSLFLNNMGDLLINYYLGRSAYETKRYELALSAYDRILIQNPNNTRVRLESAHTYMKMGLFNQSIKDFKIVLEDEKLPKNIKKTILSKIAFMENKQKKHFVNTIAMAGILYDSNVDALPSKNAFDIYVPEYNSMATISSNSKKKSATIYQVIGRANHTYKYSDNFILNSSATALAMKYLNYKKRDIHALSLSITPSFLQKEYKIDTPLLFDKINLGHKSYQNNLYMNPSYSRIINSSILYTTGFKLGKINFVKEKNKNATLLEFQNRIKYLSDSYGLFSLGLNLGKEIEDKEIRTDVDHDYYDITLANSYDLINDYTIQTSFNYKEFYYSDKDVNFLTKRKDKKSEISLSLQKKIANNLLLNVGSSYLKRDSNHASFDYDKYMLKANLLWNFKVY